MVFFNFRPMNTVECDKICTINNTHYIVIPTILIRVPTSFKGSFIFIYYYHFLIIKVRESTD